MSSFSDDLCAALTAEMKCKARENGITLQEQFNRFCLAYGVPGASAPTAEDAEVMAAAVKRALIGR